MDSALRENELLETVFQVTLSDARKEISGRTFLADLAKELAGEGSEALLCEPTVERALVARLCEPPAGSLQEHPMHYLVGCWGRASDAIRNAGDAARRQAVSVTLGPAKDLCVSYACLLTMAPGTFPEPPLPPGIEYDGDRAGVPSWRALLDSAALAAGAAVAEAGAPGSALGPELAHRLRAGAPPPPPLPPGFVDALFPRVAEEAGSPETAVEPLLAEWRALALRVSLLGEHAAVVGALTRLLACKDLARAAAQSRQWLARPRASSSGRGGRGASGGEGGPDGAAPAILRGRDVETGTVLGALLSISSLPDLAAPEARPTRLPDSVAECFRDPTSRRQGDLREAIRGLQASARALHDAQHAIVMGLLRDPATKEPTLAFLRQAVVSNEERAKMHPDASVAATDGFMLNLDAVLLRICGPFLDPRSGKAWPKLDARALADASAACAPPQGETRLAADEASVAEAAAEVAREFREEAEALAAAGPSAAAAQTDSSQAPQHTYHFVCESFFLTARALGLGMVKSVDQLRNASRRAVGYHEAAEEAREFLRRYPNHPTATRRAQALERAADVLRAADVAFQTVLLEPTLLSMAVRFYGLLGSYLLRLAALPVAPSDGPAAPAEPSARPTDSGAADTGADEASPSGRPASGAPGGAGAPAPGSARATTGQAQVDRATPPGLWNAAPASAALNALPLPLPVPRPFSLFPERYLEDLGEAVSLAARSGPETLESGSVDEFLLLCTALLGSPAHVRNPWLRSRLAEALHSLMPPPPDGGDLFEASSAEREEARGGGGFAGGLGGAGGGLGPRGGAPRARRPASAARLDEALGSATSPVGRRLVPALVRLYVDIEMTDRHNTFYEKFTTRYQIGEILAFLWGLDVHRRAWRRLAEEDEYLYVRFVNMMINDSQFLLQEALETIPGVREAERAMADSAAWAALPAAERAEREEALRADRGRLKSDLYLASVCVATMRATAADVALSRTFFAPGLRDRQARILGFFLKSLVLPEERKKLRLRDPERYNWRPRLLLSQLAAIHVALYRARPAEWVAACVADTDHLGQSPHMLHELARVLRGISARGGASGVAGTGSLAAGGAGAPGAGAFAPPALSSLPDERDASMLSDADVAVLERLARAVDAARREQEEEDEDLSDAPAEFEDPVMGVVMRDPVRLPSGNIVDRGTISQVLLTDQRDPFSRAPMTEADIEEMPELKERILRWIADQRAKKQKTHPSQPVDDMSLDA